jgi:hypothetical protein
MEGVFLIRRGQGRFALSVPSQVDDSLLQWRLPERSQWISAAPKISNIFSMPLHWLLTLTWIRRALGQLSPLSGLLRQEHHAVKLRVRACLGRVPSIAMPRRGTCAVSAFKQRSVFSTACCFFDLQQETRDLKPSKAVAGLVRPTGRAGVIQVICQ